MFKSTKELEDGVDAIKLSPKDGGSVEHIVCRPEAGDRKVLEDAQLDVKLGLVGDNWLARGDRKNTDGLAHPEMQLNLMNSRAISLIAQTKDRWKLAGDQFFIDLDLSPDNLPPGTILSIGDALIQITVEPHLGCKKFLERFGRDAAVFVNSTLGKSLNLRGVNAKVIEPGKVKVGSLVKKVTA